MEHSARRNRTRGTITVDGQESDLDTPRLDEIGDAFPLTREDPLRWKRPKKPCMKKRDNAKPNTASLDELIEEITVDASGNDEQLWAFRQAFEDNIDVPCDATVSASRLK
jgi:hypothetical protein